MRPIYYRETLVRVGEVWFRAEQEPSAVDVARYMQVGAPMAGCGCEEFYTLVLDLTAKEDDLWRGVDRGTRYEVRRAERKDRLAHRHGVVHELDDLRTFIAVYDSARSSNSAPRLKLGRLEALARAGLLDWSTVGDETRTLTWHLHVVTDGTARLLYSVSELSTSPDQELQRLRGRANRFHHWLDIQRFKGDSNAKYDFGGFYAGHTDQKRLQINFFKSGFGGTVVPMYNCMSPRTAVGRLALGGRTVMKRLDKSR